MIVRIMADDQYRLDEAQPEQIGAIQQLDEELAQAIQRQDEERFHTTLARLIAHIHRAGKAIARDEIAASDMIVPASDMSLAEVRDMLALAQER